MRAVPASPRKIALVLAGLAAAGAVLAIDSPLHHFGAHGAKPALAAAVTLLMAFWWISEAVPIQVTACVPFAVYPFTDVFGDAVGANLRGAWLPYLDPYNFLFLGGMGIAAAMQQWNLHRRIALRIMGVVGTEPARILLGVLVATAAVSLWISNTATAAMMFPIGLAVIHEFERHSGRRLAAYGAAVMLAVAYGANVGGIGTKIGTVPSAMLSGFLEQRGSDVSFLSFMAVGVPFVALFLPVAWLALWRVGRRDAPGGAVGSAALAAERARLGPMQRGERVVLAVFVAAAALWIGGLPLTNALAPLVSFTKLRTAHVEAATALAAAAALLLWRVQGRAALELRSLRTLQWDALLLLGGSFAMAAAVEASGLSQWLGLQLAALKTLPAFAQVVVASLFTVAASAFASNAATTAVMLPVLAGSVAPEHVTTVLFAATFAASCDFALPAGTPPNAIVFGSGYVSVPVMARTGVLLDALAAIIVAAWCWLAVPVVL
jgi:sodium-dependent dicarboxylate transporter 2/3/5